MIEQPSPRLPIHTVEGMFEKLKWDEARLVESWSVYDSWNFVVTTYHLYEDWIRKDNSIASPAQRARLKNLPDEAKDLFQAMRQIANASKHFDLHGKRKDEQTVGEISDLGVSDYDSYFFGDMISIPYDGRLVSISAASALVMRYFEWVIYGGDKASLDEMNATLANMPAILRP